MIVDLGLIGIDALGDAILLVEWPDRLPALRPAGLLTVRLDFGPSPDSRRVTLAGTGRWHALLKELDGG